MTTTDELFLPTRLVYEVYDAKKLRAWLENTSCLTWHPVKRGWTWDYDGPVRKMGFPRAYEVVPKQLQPVVLATCYLVDNQTLHVYTRCGFRTVKFLVFFDQQVSRSVALGKFIDEYNLVTSVRPGDPIPFPEEYFKDESKLQFHDLIGLLDLPDSPVKQQAVAAFTASLSHKTLSPLERHRLEGFYHDGAALMEQAMRFRDILAMLQSESDTPIRPMDVMANLLGEAPNSSSAAPSR